MLVRLVTPSGTYIPSSKQVMNCASILDVGKDPVQAENCLAGLEFFSRATVVDLRDPKIDESGTFLEDPVTGMVSAMYRGCYQTLFNLGCFASMYEVIKLYQASDRIGMRDFWERGEDDAGILSKFGLTSSHHVTGELQELCMEDICRFGARCITKCPSIRPSDVEDCALARWPLTTRCWRVTHS